MATLAPAVDTDRLAVLLPPAVIKIVGLSAGDRNISSQPLLLAEQAGILKRLHVRQVAQRVEAEMRKEFLRRHIGVGRSRLRRPRPGGDETQVSLRS